jgi:DNA mismatch repair protein MSH4
MNLHYPSLILVPDTFLSVEDTSSSTGSKKSSLLMDCIRDEFEEVPVEPVGRKYWNENIGRILISSLERELLIYIWLGLQFITELSLDDEERAATLVSSSNKRVVCFLFSSFYSCCLHRYYALSAVCALFKHAEMKLNTRYVAGSLRIRYCPVEGTMMIDSETIRNLELVGNLSFRKSSHSLFG